LGVLKDILDTIKDVKEHVKDDENFKIQNMKMKSISKMSSDAIMQFPVIVSKTLSIQDITMVSKALEREYASFVRIAISMRSNETDYTNPDEFIKRFHSNTDDHYPIKDLMINVASDIADSDLFEESAKLLKDKQQNYRKILDNINTLIESSTALYSDKNIKNIISDYNLKQNKIDGIINENGIEIIPFIKLYNFPRMLEAVYNYLKKNKDDGNNIYMYNSEAYIIKDTDYGTRISSLKIMREGTTTKVFTTPYIIMMKNISYDNFMKTLESGNKELLKEFVNFNMDCLNEKFQPENYSVYHKIDPLNEAILYKARPGSSLYRGGTSNTIYHGSSSGGSGSGGRSSSGGSGSGNNKNDPDQNININNPTINIDTPPPLVIDRAQGPTSIYNDMHPNINVQQPANLPKPIDLKDTLLDNDVKKSNELVPTMLGFRVHFKNGENVVPLDFIIGIKTVAHPVSADEIIKNLSKGLKEKNTFFNFIRWTTGEIKFLKDFILNIDGIKDDVLEKSGKGSQWWLALKRRKNIAKFRATLMMKKQILPNATIVVSTEEVTYLKNEYGVDLFNPRTVKELMDYYFLLGFVILDPSTELAYFMFDGYSGYQTFSYEALERENQNTAKELKNIMTVLGKL
jgi:uncharacterized membrane protein YgcG